MRAGATTTPTLITADGTLHAGAPEPGLLSTLS
jgi:hypothetical protein